MKIIAIYDGGEKFADRYTVYLDTKRFDRRFKVDFYDCIAMDDIPQHPQGFCQHSSGQLGKHNGKKITLEQLPLQCQKIIHEEIEYSNK
jgi:hypothetical protein